MYKQNLEYLLDIEDDLVKKLDRENYNNVESIASVSAIKLQSILDINRERANKIIERAKFLKRLRDLSKTQVCLDDLKGVGPVTAKKLRDAEFTTIESLALISIDELLSRVKMTELKCATIIASAREKCEKILSDVILRDVRGVGPTTEKNLRTAGINTISILSKLSPTELAHQARGFDVKKASKILEAAKEQSNKIQSDMKLKTELELKDLNGVKDATEKKLKDAGINTVSILAVYSPEKLVSRVSGLNSMQRAKDIIKVARKKIYGSYNYRTKYEKYQKLRPDRFILLPEIDRAYIERIGYIYSKVIGNENFQRIRHVCSKVIRDENVRTFVPLLTILLKLSTGLDVDITNILAWSPFENGMNDTPSQAFGW